MRPVSKYHETSGSSEHPFDRREGTSESPIQARPSRLRTDEVYFRPSRYKRQSCGRQATALCLRVDDPRRFQPHLAPTASELPWGGAILLSATFQGAPLSLDHSK